MTQRRPLPKRSQPISVKTAHTARDIVRDIKQSQDECAAMSEAAIVARPRDVARTSTESAPCGNLMNLRDRIRVPTIRLIGWHAAIRRISEMAEKRARGETPDSGGLDLRTLVQSEPGLLKPLAVPVISPSLINQAVEGLEERNVERFLGSTCGNEYSVDLLAANVRLLKELDLYPHDGHRHRSAD